MSICIVECLFLLLLVIQPVYSSRILGTGSQSCILSDTHLWHLMQEKLLCNKNSLK